MDHQAFAKLLADPLDSAGARRAAIDTLEAALPFDWELELAAVTDLLGPDERATAEAALGPAGDVHAGGPSFGARRPERSAA